MDGVIINIDDHLQLRQYAVVDAPAIFGCIDASRDHLNQHGNKTSEKYPDIASVEDSIRNPKNPNRLRLGIWDKETFVGSINLDPSTPSKNDYDAEVGYWLGEQHQGKGCMSRALKQVTLYAFRDCKYQRVCACVNPANEKSLRVLENVGYKVDSGCDELCVLSLKGLNIRGDSSDWRAAILSNLASTQIKIGRYVCPSVESLIQGIKFKDPAKRERVFGMKGMDALRNAHKYLSNSELEYVYWNGEQIPYRSKQHLLLLSEFIAGKVRQHEKVAQAIIETDDVFIYHDVGPESPHTSLPEKFYMEVLIAQRHLLKRIYALPHVN